MRRTRTALAAGFVAAIVVAMIPAVSGALQAGRAPADCLRDQVGVRSNGTNGAAGTIRGAWVFTNLSDSSCSLYGYPGLQLFGKAGRPIPTTVTRTLAPAPSEVTLAPGASATFLSSYSDVIEGSAHCPTSAVLQVTPPNATESLFIPAQLQACNGVIQVSAVEAGVHPA